MTNVATLQMRLECFVREEVGGWAALCPALEVASQGESETHAREMLNEAIELCLETCLEAGTLEQALKDLGWTSFAEAPDVQPLDDGKGFPVEFTIPAYQTATHLAAS